MESFVRWSPAVLSTKCLMTRCSWGVVLILNLWWYKLWDTEAHLVLASKIETQRGLKMCMRLCVSWTNMKLLRLVAPGMSLQLPSCSVGSFCGSTAQSHSLMWADCRSSEFGFRAASPVQPSDTPGRLSVVCKFVLRKVRIPFLWASSGMGVT